MLYVKNVPAWERVLRIGAGAGAAWASMHFLTGPVAIVAAACTAGTALSGLVGYCPMRALVGRKPDRSEP
jgi:hypothetical protein